MTDQNSQDTTYHLLKFISRQPIQISRLIAKGLAGLVNVLKISKTYSTIQRNLKIALPELSESARIQLTKQAIRNELCSYFEFFNIWGASTEKNIQRIHHVHGAEYLHEALALQKGVVLVVPHFGTWEIMNAWVAQYTQMTIMYKPVKSESANNFVRAARSREQAILVPTDESGVRQIFKALKQGGTTVILPDHTPNAGGEMIPYFGIPLKTSNLSAKLIQKTKARALLLYAIRNDNHGFDMHIEPMDENIYQGNADDGSIVIFKAVEDLIHRYPEHYHWSYKRFKANPKLRNLYNISDEEAAQRIRDIREEYQRQQKIKNVTE